MATGQPALIIKLRDTTAFLVNQNQKLETKRLSDYRVLQAQTTNVKVQTKDLRLESHMAFTGLFQLYQCWYLNPKLYYVLGIKSVDHN